MRQREVQSHPLLQRALARCTGPLEGELYFALPTHCEPSASSNSFLMLLQSVFAHATDRYTPALKPGQVSVHTDGLVRMCVQQCAGPIQDPISDSFAQREIYLYAALRALSTALVGRTATIVLPPTHPEIDTYNEIVHDWIGTLRDGSLHAVLALDLDAIAAELDAQATNEGATAVLVQACGMLPGDGRTYPSSEHIDAHLSGTLGVTLTDAENGIVVDTGHILTSLADNTESHRLWRWGLSSRPSLRTAHDALCKLGTALRAAQCKRIALPTDVVRMLSRTPEMHNAYRSWVDMLKRHGILARELDLGERPSIRRVTRPAIAYPRITDFFSASPQ